MPAAIFYHPVTGMVTHFVVTDVADGPNALQPHLDAAKAAGLSVLQMPKLPAGHAVFDAVAQITGKPARLLDDPVLAANPEPAARTTARATAFHAAILRGETYAQAMTAGQAAAMAVSVGPALV